MQVSTDFLTRLLCFSTVACMMAMLSSGKQEQRGNPDHSSVSGSNQVKKPIMSLEEMFPPQRIARIKKKELRKYKQAQEKKWKNWLESVSK